MRSATLSPQGQLREEGSGELWRSQEGIFSLLAPFDRALRHLCRVCHAATEDECRARRRVSTKEGGPEVHVSKSVGKETGE